MMCKLTFFFAICLLALSAATLAQESVSVTVLNATPASAVQQLQDGLMASAKVASFEKRVEQLSPIVERTHNFSLIARLVTGQHWRKFEEQQREQFIDAFAELSIVTYAERFKDLGDSTFNYVETLEQPRNSKKVISTFALDPNASFSELSDNNSFTFEYIVQPLTTTDKATNQQWQIINVIVDGVSDLALKRSNYVSTLNEQGLDGLLAELTEKIADIRRKSS